MSVGKLPESDAPQDKKPSLAQETVHIIASDEASASSQEAFHEISRTLEKPHAMPASVVMMPESTRPAAVRRVYNVGCLFCFPFSTQGDLITFQRFLLKEIKKETTKDSLKRLIDDFLEDIDHIKAVFRLHHRQEELNLLLVQLKRDFTAIETGFSDAHVIEILAIKYQVDTKEKKKSMKAFLEVLDTDAATSIFHKVGFNPILIETLSRIFRMEKSLKTTGFQPHMVEEIETLLTINSHRLTIKQVQELLIPMGLEGVYRPPRLKKVSFAEEISVMTIESRREVLDAVLARLKRPKIEDLPLVELAKEGIKKILGLEMDVINMEELTSSSQIAVARYCLYFEGYSRAERLAIEESEPKRALARLAEISESSAKAPKELRYPVEGGRWHLIHTVKPLPIRTRFRETRVIHSAIFAHEIPKKDLESFLNKLKNLLYI